MSRLSISLASLLAMVAVAVGAAGVARAARADSTASPADVTAIPGSSSATVRWAGPSMVDGAPVKSFTVTASTGQTMTAEFPNQWAIVPGLANGVPVTFTVTATSSAGTSAASSPSAAVTPEPVPPPRNVLLGRPRSVTYDHYSLMVGGRRVLLWAGEFDYYRLPSPSLWLDRLEEMKAAGFNAVSIYFDWDYTSPAPGVYDFSGVRDINRLLNDAQRVGLYVLARPGPYINAETDAGGLAGWLASEPPGSRTDDPEYLAAADQWLSEVDPIIAAHQVTRGGDVILYQIENEYGFVNPSGEAYFENLEAQAAKYGIDVPTYTNNVGGFANGWAPGTPGAPDLNGSDQYPQGFDCSNPAVFNTPPVLTSDHNPGTPLTVPEYQGGSFDSWGGAGYPSCARLVGPDWENAFYRYYLAQGVTMQSIYMTVGGTDWGFNPAPFMYTSYDYGSAISEPGTLSFKYPQLKLASELSQALPALAETDQVTAPSVPGLITFEERNPVNGTTFLYLGNAGSRPVSTFLPGDPGARVTIRPRSAKLLVSNARFGGVKLLDTTSELITQLRLGTRTVALFDGDHGAAGVLDLHYASQPVVRVLAGSLLARRWNQRTGVLRLRYRYGRLIEVSVRSGGRRLLALIGDQATAASFWVRRTGPGAPLLVRGSSLLRSASLRGSRAVLRGDTTGPTWLRVWAPDGVSRLVWNGAAVNVVRRADGSLVARVGAAAPRLALPDLDHGWRFKLGSAERLPGYDDSAWPVADHQVTDNPVTPVTLPVLYAQDYGFDHGFVWYRGHFTATGHETGITLTADGGPFGSFAVWLNGHYLGWAAAPTSTHPFANMDDTAVTKTFSFPAGTVRAGQPVVVSVLTENMGQDESYENSLGLDSNKTPRGLEGAVLNVSSGAAPAVTWRLEGASAAQAERDPLRGPTNPAGLGESNAGWQLPGYSDTSWKPVSLPSSLSDERSGAAVGWYRQRFSLHLPAGVWAPMGLRFIPPGGGAPGPGRPAFQALIYVNGWLVGRYINNLGPQDLFYVPQGLLRYDGTNTVAVAIWSQDGGAGGIGGLRLEPYEVERGGIPVQDLSLR